MPHAAPPPEPDVASEILARCLQGPPQARTLLLDQACAEHPERAASLRQLYGLLDEFGFVDEPPDDGPAVAAPRLAPPERIGPYRILATLGSGGMGIVYLAEQESLSRRVALKVIHGPLARTAKARARFRREATLAARLDDPRICPVHEIGEADDGTPFLVMRHVPGTTLAQAIADAATAGGRFVVLPPRDGAAGIDAVLRCIEDVALALHAAHRQGLVHRDVKPGNVMITPEGAPVLLDFGLAASADDSDDKLTQSGDQLGTPAYMAPEQILGRAVDARTDVYALGATLYECLTLRPPFTAVLRHDLTSQVLREEPPDPRKSQRAVSRDLWTVLQVALAKEPARRYASAAAFAEDLRRLRRREPILARRAGVGRRLVRFAQRYPLAATMFVVLSAAVAVFAVLVEQRTAAGQAQRAIAMARTTPAAAVGLALGALQAHPSVDTTSALQEVLPLQRERLQLVFGASTYNVQFRPDGERIVVCTDGGQVAMFDRQGTRLSWHGHNLRPGIGARPVYWIEWAPAVAGQPERFATASDDGSARVFGRDGKLLHVLDHRNVHNQKGRVDEFTSFFDADAYPEVWRARFAPDGIRLATYCSDRHVRIWDSMTGSLIGVLEPAHKAPMGLLAWSSSGWLASADDQQNWNEDTTDYAVRVWQPGQNGMVLAHTFPMSQSVHDVAWSPDGMTLVAACHDGFAWVFDLARSTADPVRLPHGGPVWSATFSPDGLRILTASGDHMLRLWTRSGEQVFSARHEGPALDAEYAGGSATDGPLRILSTSWDSTVRVFDADLREQFVLRGHTDLTVQAVLSPDGRQVASTSWDNTVRLWDLVDPELPRLVGHRGRVRGLARLPDGRVLSVADDRTARIWDLATARASSVPLPATPWNVQVAVDGTRLLLGGEDGRVHEVGLANGAVLATHASPRTQWAVGAWLGDGRTAVAGRTSLHVVDGDQRTTWSNVDTAIYALAPAPRRNVLAGSGRNSHVQLWDAAGRALPGLPLPERIWALALAWSPDESRLGAGAATGAATGGEVWVWDVPADPSRTAAPPLRLGGHEDAVLAVAWSPNGSLLAAGVGDGTVHLWLFFDSCWFGAAGRSQVIRELCVAGA
ncbi:MAG: protein kinase [Planctomycetota bacterium]